MSTNDEAAEGGLHGETQFVDIAVNLTDLMFQGEYHGKSKHLPDMAAVIARAAAVGCSKMLLTGGNLESSREALSLARALDPAGRSLFCTVGVHPTRCDEFTDNPEKHMETLRELIRGNLDRVVAIGEMGLDYDRTEFCSADVQQRFFALQLDLAREFQLPMFLHMREARADFLRILEESRDVWKGCCGVVHSFTGTVEDAQAILSHPELSLGINGCSLKTEDNLKVLAAIPPERLLLETDAPYCDIRPTHASFAHVKTIFPSVKKPEKWSEGMQVKGRNEPCNIIQVAEVVDSVVGERCSQIALQNALTLFPKLA